MRGFASIDDLVAGVRRAAPRAVARAISLVENESPRLPELVAGLASASAGAHVIGLTGSPGVGKSTTTDALVRELRSRELTVGVLAVDPSSPFSGGALLGDRIRMQDHTGDPGVIIRSMATRGHLGGLAAAAPMAVSVLAAAGRDVVLVETVGVGQSEVEIAGLCDTTCVLVAPGAGDHVQAAKAGLLEVGDVFVVNKADRDGVQPLIRDLRNSIALGSWGADAWKPPIVTTTATSREGIEELWHQIERHRAHQEGTGAWQVRRRARARHEVEALVLAEVRRRTKVPADGALLDELAEAVAVGSLDPYAASRLMLDRLGAGA
ncbi:methylmalonyl Co-A mutase-associated GTPase MeaB [Propionibacteriaceae bacterium Y2011]